MRSFSQFASTPDDIELTGVASGFGAAPWASLMSGATKSSVNLAYTGARRLRASAGLPWSRQSGALLMKDAPVSTAVPSHEQSLSLIAAETLHELRLVQFMVIMFDVRAMNRLSRQRWLCRRSRRYIPHMRTRDLLLELCLT
jgi:hypothetical protein